MFTVTERLDIRAWLIALAGSDGRVAGAALVGSAARDAEDDWSDIDLVLQLAPRADEPAVVDEWTRLIDKAWDVADTHDVVAGAVRYRVFLLRSSLQLDVSFWPNKGFRATEAGFTVLFGTPNDPTEPTRPDAHAAVGMGWLYAVHARSAVARGRLWQAAMMLDELRNSILTLKCIRFGLNPAHGREVDALPQDELTALEAARASGLTAGDLDRNRLALNQLFLHEIELHDRRRFERLRGPFRSMNIAVG